MSNSLSDKQKDRLYQWLRAGKAGDLSRGAACTLATIELACDITYTNMRSAEEVTGISLVKPPKVKESSTDLAARIYDLERTAKEQSELIRAFAEWSQFPMPPKLVDAYIKPSANKPNFCHKHG